MEIAEILGYFFAIVAAGIALFSLIYARRTMRFSFIASFLDRDADPEMGRAIRRLWAFKREASEPIEERFSDLEQTDHARWLEIDDDRRLVHKHYIHMMQLKKAKLLNEDLMMTILLGHNYSTVFEILEPLESKKVGKNHTVTIFDEYRQLQQLDEHRRKRLAKNA